MSKKNLIILISIITLVLVLVSTFIILQSGNKKAADNVNKNSTSIDSTNFGSYQREQLIPNKSSQNSSSNSKLTFGNDTNSNLSAKQIDPKNPSQNKSENQNEKLKLDNNKNNGKDTNLDSNGEDSTLLKNGKTNSEESNLTNNETKKIDVNNPNSESKNTKPNQSEPETNNITEKKPESNIGNDNNIASNNPNFELVKQISETKSLLKIENFDKTKLTLETLITPDNFYPNKKSENLFIQKDGQKYFLGYGATNTFEFRIGDTDYNITIFDDETGYPVIILTDAQYQNQQVINPTKDFSSATITQKDNSSVFKIEGVDGNGSRELVRTVNFEVDIRDFIPKN